MAFVKLPKGMASVMIEEMLIEAKDGIIWVRDGLEDHVCSIVPGATKVAPTAPDPIFHSAGSAGSIVSSGTVTS